MTGRAHLACAVVQGLLADGWPTHDATDAADVAKGHSIAERRTALAVRVWSIVDAVSKHTRALDAFADDEPPPLLYTEGPILPDPAWMRASMDAHRAQGQQIADHLQRVLAAVSPTPWPPGDDDGDVADADLPAPDPFDLPLRGAAGPTVVRTDQVPGDMTARLAHPMRGYPVLVDSLAPDEWRLIASLVLDAVAPDDVLSYAREQDATVTLQRKLRDTLADIAASDLDSH